MAQVTCTIKSNTTFERAAAKPTDRKS